MLKFIKKLLISKNETVSTQLERTYFKNTFIELGLGLNIIRESGNVIFVKTGDTLGQSCALAYNSDKIVGLLFLRIRQKERLDKSLTN